MILDGVERNLVAIAYLKSGAPNGSFRSNICSADLNRLKYLDLIEVKTRNFFGETSPQTFVKRRLINCYDFQREKYVV